MAIKSRYEELKQQIHFHNHRYHVLDAPIISDAEFDKLLNELKRIEADHPDWDHGRYADAPRGSQACRPFRQGEQPRASDE